MKWSIVLVLASALLALSTGCQSVRFDRGAGFYEARLKTKDFVGTSLSDFEYLFHLRRTPRTEASLENVFRGERRYTLDGFDLIVPYTIPFLAHGEPYIGPGQPFLVTTQSP